ncbi:MAG: DNA-directed RNA polymerase subunit omega, partial [Verrucomicrobiales bacterium]
IIPFPTSGAPATGSTGAPNMRSDLVEEAAKVITVPAVLINIVSRRVRQLNHGRRPLVMTEPRMGAADIALKEIIEGKLRIEGYDPDAKN